MGDNGVAIPMENINNSANSTTTTYNQVTSEKIRNGNFEVLKNYVEDNDAKEVFTSATAEGKRTPLHDVCDCEDKKEGKKMLDKLLNKYKRWGAPKNDKFIDKLDERGNAALHYALDRKHRYAVQQLIDNGADVNLKNERKQEAVASIYEHFPKTIMSLLNRGNLIELGNSEDEEDDDDEKRITNCDFGAIIGINVDRDKIYETYMLSNVLRLKKQTKAKFLEFPIVQLFLDLKWGKMKWLIYASMGFHILWSLLSVYVIGSIFMTKYENGTNTTEEWESLEIKRWKLFAEDKSQRDFSYTTTVFSVTLLVFTFVMAVKELIEIRSTPKIKMYVQMENLGQWLLIISTILLVSNAISKFLPVWCDYNMSIAAVITSCLLVLGQFNKHPNLGLYMEMFLESLKHFGLLFFWFSPILVAFTLGFGMLMPDDDKFHIWPPWGLLKIEAMSAGEYNYDEIYGHDVVAIKLPKNLLILAFITTVGIVLANLLIGLVVSDVKSLQDKAKVSSLATQLEQMYLMEAFITTNLRWYPGLSETCSVTENKSIMTIWPLCCPKFLWDRVKSIFSSNEQYSSVPVRYHQHSGVNMVISQDSPDAPTELQQPEGNRHHIIAKPMKSFSRESRTLLMNLKTQ